MPVAFKTALGSSSPNIASSSSWTITTTAAIAVGDLVVVRAAADNLSATTPTFTCADSGGNTYTTQRQAAANATAAAGVAGAIMCSKATVAVASGGTITITLSGAVVAKAAYAESFTGVDNTVRSTAVSATAASGTALASPASGTVNAGDLVLGASAIESRGAVTGDADTTNGSWSARELVLASASGTDTARVEVSGQYKIPNASGAQTFNQTVVSTDWVAMLVVLQATLDPAITQASYRIYDQGTESGSTALGAQDTAINGDLSFGDGIGALRVRLQSTNAGVINATDDWQLQWEKNASGSWSDVVGALISGYAYEGHFTGFRDLGTTTTGAAQSFIGNGKPVKAARFHLQRQTVGVAGTVQAHIWAHDAGTFGSTGEPTGSPLASSSTVLNAADLPASSAWTEFTFSGAFTPVAGTAYCVGLLLTGATGTAVRVGFHSGSPTHPGCESYFNSAQWWSGSTIDLIFEVASDPPTGVIGYDDTNLTDGGATTNRLGAGTGSFVAGKISESGLVANLGWTASNYTELLFPVQIMKANFIDGDTIRFRVLRNGATTGMTYTVTPLINVVSIDNAATISSDWGAGPGGLTTPVSYNFTYGSGTELDVQDSNWPAETFFGSSVYADGSVCALTANDATRANVLSSSIFNNPVQDVTFDIHVDNHTNCQVRAILNWNPTTNSGYVLDPSLGTIVRYNSGTPTTLAGPTSPPGGFTTSGFHTLNFTSDGNGTLKISYGGTPYVTVTADPSPLTHGQVGMIWFANFFSNASSDNFVVVGGGPKLGWAATATGTVSTPAGTNYPGTISTNWGGWTATADGTVSTPSGTNWPGTIASNWGTWTGTSAAAVTHPATVATSWGTWTATAVGALDIKAVINVSWGTWAGTSAAVVTHPATVATSWGTWTATAVGAPEKVATIATNWGTWTATSIGARGHPATIATNWGTWTGTSAAGVDHPATIATSWGTWTATATGATTTPVNRVATIATNWGSWTATADGVITAAGNQPGFIATNWGSWTATATGILNIKGVVDTNWGTWAATGTALVDHPATVNVNWGSWTATAVGALDVKAVIATSWGTWTATSIAGVDHPATVNVNWGSWTATAIGAVASGAVNHPATIASNWGSWTATGVAAPSHPATIATNWGTWVATSIAGVDHPATVATSWGTWAATATGVASTPVNRVATIATNWGTWTATADGVITAAGNQPGFINVNWGTWTATAVGALNIKGVIATSWGTWAATATGVLDHRAIVNVNWGGWTATAVGAPEKVATISTNWGGWAATSIAGVSHPATVATNWGTWTATATGNLNHVATISTSWGTWTATAVGALNIKSVIASSWGTWTATAIGARGHPAIIAMHWGTWTATANGFVGPTVGTVLNTADAVYLGITEVDRVYAGATLVWP